MSRLIDRIRQTMLDHQWRTLAVISITADGNTDSVSSLMRQLRRKEHGGFTVEKRFRPVDRAWEYRIAPPPEIQCKPTPPVKKPATIKAKKPPMTHSQKIAREIMVGVFSRLIK
jgi:hypothetical protein